MSPAVWIALITAITGLLGAVGGIISAWRGHLVVNNQVKPQAQANTDAVLRLAADAGGHTETEVRKIINGAAASGNQPG